MSVGEAIVHSDSTSQSLGSSPNPTEIDMAAAKAQESYRRLWAQVVLQAKSDLDAEPIDSILFNQAAAFFVGRGEWAASRANVADCLEMHPDALGRCGERWIAERRQREGLEPAPSAAFSVRSPAPLSRLVAVPSPDPQAAKGRRTITPRQVNPFNPFRMQSTQLTA